MDLLNLRDSSADSKRYNKTYAAGKLVNYKPAGYNYEKGKLVRVASQGRNIRMPAKPGGPQIDGWTLRYQKGQKTLDNEGWVYLSKWFTIPTSKRPMAVYVCWRALEKNTTIKLRLSRGINKVWGNKDGAYHINFTHRFESDPNRYREIACWGFYDVGYQYGVRIKKSIKAKLFIKVPEGGIELASIKIFEPTKPQEHDSNGYYLRQFETDITR